MTTKKITNLNSSIITINKFWKGKHVDVVVSFNQDKLVNKILESMSDKELREVESIGMEILETEKKLKKWKLELDGKLMAMAISPNWTGNSYNILRINKTEKTALIDLLHAPDAGAKSVSILKNMNETKIKGGNHQTGKLKGAATYAGKDAGKHDEKHSSMFVKTKQKTQAIDDGTDDDFVVSKKAMKVLKKFQKKNTKIVSDSADASSWTSKQFHEYMQKKFTKTYHHDSLEFNLIGNNFYSKKASGILWTNIKHKLINVFEGSGMTKVDLKNYIDWMFDVKSATMKFPITLGFISNKGVMTEWIINNKKKKQTHHQSNNKNGSSIKIVNVNKK